MLKYQNYIFDLDGTLINSSEEVLNCFQKAFNKANYYINPEKFSSDIIGPPLKQIMQLIAPDLKDEDKINEIMLNFRQIYDYDDADISVMYAGIQELLCELKNSGCRLFIATFKPKIPTMRLVEMFNLKELFNDVYTIDKFGTKITKEEMITNIISTYRLDKSQTVMIGDAASDMTAAKGAGIEGIGVLWGYGSNKTSLKENADYIVKDVEELRESWKPVKIK